MPLRRGATVNAPLRFMLTAHEATAHLATVEVLSLAAEGELSHKAVVNMLWDPLTSFAPRCNCGQVLSFGPWREGRRFVACRCGVTYSECGLWHGVPKVEAPR